MIHRSFDAVCLRRHIEAVPQHHGRGQDAGDGVDDILSGDVRGRAVDGLVQPPGAVPQAGGGHHADAAGDLAGLVGQDVAEHVLRDNHVELGGILADLHGAVVHEHLPVFHVRVLRRQAVHHLPPQAAGVQHIGLVHAGELFPALAGGLKADAADPLDLVLGIGHGVHGDLLAVFLVGPVLPEVDAADQLAHHNKVNAFFHDGGLQGRGVRQLGPDFGRAVVGVKPHAGPEPQEALFRPLVTGQALPLGAADGSQQHAVALQALVQFRLGQGVPVGVDGLAAHQDFRIGKGVAEFLSHRVQHPQGLGDDLRAGAVAVDHRDILLHTAASLPRLDAGHQAAGANDLLDEGREGLRLEGLACGLVGDDAGVKVHRHRVPLPDGSAG